MLLNEELNFGCCTRTPDEYSVHCMVKQSKFYFAFLYGARMSSVAYNI